jgi:serine/threonine-protein kinase
MLAHGDILDRNYEVMELVAVGGAGVTYRARELGPDGAPTGTDLAIKVLHSRRASGAFLQRLANEARILQGLRHDHIVECLGFSQRKGAPPYLVTRFERGGTLEAWALRHGQLPPWTVAGVLRQIFEGLAAAHRKGVVHRDLKPANLLLAHETPPNEIPHVRIADFGIAKVTGKLNEGLTRAGAFIGTPRYAAPEQFSGAPATSATPPSAGTPPK